MSHQLSILQHSIVTPDSYTAHLIAYFSFKQVYSVVKAEGKFSKEEQHNL